MGDAVRVLSTLALKGAVHSLAGQFEIASGVHIDADFAPTLALLDRLRGAGACGFFRRPDGGVGQGRSIGSVAAVSCVAGGRASAARERA